MRFLWNSILHWSINIIFILTYWKQIIKYPCNWFSDFYFMHRYELLRYVISIYSFWIIRLILNCIKWIKIFQQYLNYPKPKICIILKTKMLLLSTQVNIFYILRVINNIVFLFWNFIWKKSTFKSIKLLVWHKKTDFNLFTVHTSSFKFIFSVNHVNVVTNSLLIP